MPFESVARSASPSETFAYQWCLTGVGVGAITINFLMIIMFLRFQHKLLTKNHNLLLLSLAIADFCVGIGCTLGGQMFYFYTQRKINLAVYKLTAAMPYFGSFFISISSLIIMTADRLMSIEFPFRHRTIMTRPKIIGLIVATWLLVIGLLISQVIIFFLWHDNGWTELRARSLLLSILFCVGLIVLLISNVYIFREVRRVNSGKRINSNEIAFPTLQTTVGSTGRNSEFMHITVRRGERKTSMICIWLTLLFIICWFPVSVYYFTWVSVGEAPVGRLLMLACLSLASGNSVLNPVVYLFQKRIFRDCVKHMLPCCI